MKTNGHDLKQFEYSDLSELDAMQTAMENGIEVPILDPTGKKSMGFSIRIAGPDSKLQKQIQRELTDERLNSDDPSPLKAQDIEDRKLRSLARLTLGWGEFKLDGGIYPFNEANAFSLYTRFPFISDQVEAKAGRRAAFLEVSKRDSADQSSVG